MAAAFGPRLSRRLLSARSSASISCRRLPKAVASIGLRIHGRLSLQKQPTRRDTVRRLRPVARSETKISLNDEIAHLRGLDVKGLRARWKGMFRREPPLDLPRHLLFAMLAYRLQADELGDLAPDTMRLLKQLEAAEQRLGSCN